MDRHDVARSIPRARATGRSLLRRALVAVLAGTLCGCASLASQTYYPEGWTREQQAAWECTRTGGWWRPNIAEGYCEYQSPGFL
jgi:hypothetical protein